MVVAAAGRASLWGSTSTAIPKSPETDTYTLVFDRVEDYKLGKAFNDRDPEMQFTLVFALEYPQDDDEDDLDGMEIKNWYTGKFVLKNPDKTWPSMFKLIRAFTDNTYEGPENPQKFDLWDEIEQFARKRCTEMDDKFRCFAWEGQGPGTRFRSVVGPNDKGWARLQGDPMPLKKSKATKVQVVSIVTPDEDDDEGEEVDSGKF